MNDNIQALLMKQRISVDSTPEDSNNEQLEVESCSLYFDFLPEKALHDIVHFLSRFQFHKPNYTHLEDIHHLYDVTGELGRFLLGRFTGVYVIPKISLTIELFLDQRDCVNEGAIVCTPAFLLDFIRSGRVIPSFEYMYVGGARTPEGGMDPLELIGDCNFDSLSRQWPNIRRLVFIDGSEGNWIESFGKDLESLHFIGALSGSPTKKKIPEYCTKLLHLNIEDGFWKGIDPDMFWEKAGKHLETVCARFNRDSHAHTHYITMYCPNIKRLELLGNNNGNAQCIAFYGEQIEEAKMDFSTESDMKLLSSSCPNARFSLKTISKHGLRIALDILGPQLKALEIRNSYYRLQGDEMPDWSWCTNLESVKFYSYPTIEEMRCMMYKPKSQLKCIELLDGHKDFKKEELGEFISLIAEGTGALEKFVFECGEPLLGAFNKLVERNMALRSVKIIYSGHVPEEKKADVWETFHKCPSLKVICEVSRGPL